MSEQAKKQTMQIPEDEYNRILEEIESNESPVGIDARHTHILILHKLMEIEKRLDRLEERVEKVSG